MVQWNSNMCSRNRLGTLCVGSLSLWRGAKFDIAGATFSQLSMSDRSRCGAVRILASLAQLSRSFVHFSLLWLWFGVNFDITRATISALSACQIACVLAWTDFSCFTEILVTRSCEFSGRSFYDDLARVSWCSLRGPQYMQILTKVL